MITNLKNLHRIFRSVLLLFCIADCGFAATESWGANGYQLCDGRNVHQSIPTARPLRRW